MNENPDKRKRLRASVIAGILAAAIALTGTFAWRSMSQRAINELMDERNPGGRVHDDFNGQQNKDIYVENFTEAANGAPVFARVKLLEYMETGEDAAVNRDATDRKATPLVADSYINDIDTWQVYLPNAANDKFREYWDWTMGGETVYLPTFNRNKDSLSIDVNGTYGTYDAATGQFDPSRTPYDDYQIYTSGTAYPGTEFYDADKNQDDEYQNPLTRGEGPGGGGAVNVNYTKVENVNHTATESLHGLGIISMAEWKAAGSPICNKWVYDTDGWFYWPEPIQPETATGLLLTKAEQRKNAGERSYYAIEVVGQFASANDWGDDTAPDGDPAKGFYADGMTGDAAALLDKAATVIVGKDGGWYLPEPGTLTIYRQVLDDEGTVSGLICAGEDGLIGTEDDRTDVVYVDGGIEINGTDYGNYYLKPTADDPFYRVNNTDKRLGTNTDTRLWLVGATFPGDEVLTEAVTKVVVKPEDGATEVKAGKTLKFTAEVTTADARLTNKAVTWQVKGAQSEQTKIESLSGTTGLLTVAGSEPLDNELTIIATSKLDDRKSAEVTIKVVPKVIAVEITSPDHLRAGAQRTLAAAVKVDGEAVTDPDLDWSVTGPGGVSIEGGNILKVAESVTEGTELTVTATYTDTESGRSVTSLPQTVTVQAANAAQVTLSAAGGTTVEAGAAPITLSFTALDKDNKDVLAQCTTEWVVSPLTRAAGTGVSVEPSAGDPNVGLLTVGDSVPMDSYFTVTANVTFEGRVSSDSLEFTVAGPDAMTISGAGALAPQGSEDYTANLTRGGSPYASSAVEWEVSGNTSAKTVITPNADGTGHLTIGDDEPRGGAVTITATSKVNPSLSKTFPVNVSNMVDVEGKTKVKIDGIDYIIARKEADRALLITEHGLTDSKTFTYSPGWADSPIRTWLNGDWLASKPQLQGVVIPVDIHVRKNAAVEDWDTTTDKVFILSDADTNGVVLPGMSGGNIPATTKDYTAGERLRTPEAGWGNDMWFVRLPKAEYTVFTNGSVMELGTRTPTDTAHLLRPAVWVRTVEPST